MVIFPALLNQKEDYDKGILYPLSYFVMCGRIFISAKKAEQEGLISGVKICPAVPSISHLLFADDSLILARANREEATQLQNILELYERCSGQMINRSKSVVLFRADD